MSQAGVVVRLAVRELWITFRLLLVLVAFVSVGAVVALLPASVPDAVWRLSVGLGAATVIASAAAAWSIAEERVAGRTGWLITRSVERGGWLAGWFVALSAIALGGIIAAGALGWLAVAGVRNAPDPPEFTLAMLGIAATATAAVAAGVAVGAALPPRTALLLTTLLCSAAAAAAWIASPSSLVPGAAFVTLPRLISPGVPIADLLRAVGIGLVAAAISYLVAWWALERGAL
jgi:hypothetical protein